MDYDEDARETQIQEINGIKLIASEAEALKELQDLTGKTIPEMSLSPIIDIPLDTFHNAGFTARHGHIERIKLPDSELHAFPSALFSFTKLKEITLHVNYIDSIPDEICQFQQLERLTVGFGRNGVVSPKLGNLTSLIVLDLHSVSVPFIETDSKFPPPVISLPESLSALTKLRVLYLSNLKLIEFPSFIQKLTNLEDLSLDRDNLKIIPDIFGSLTNLEDLDLAGNHLTSLPPSFQNLKSLKYINFQANPITRFPDCLKDLPALRDVTCDDTVTNIPSNNNIKFYFYKTSGSRDKKKKQILDRISPHSYYFSVFVDNPQFFPSADQILRCLSLLSKYHFTPLPFQEQPPTNARVKAIMEDIQQHPWDRLDTSPDLVLEIPLNPRSFLQIIQKIDEPYCPREVADSGTLLFVPTGLKGVMDDSPSPGWGSKFQILGTDLHNGEWETATIDFIENKFLAKYQGFLQEITDIVHNPVKIILDWED